MFNHYMLGEFMFIELVTNIWVTNIEHVEMVECTKVDVPNA